MAQQIAPSVALEIADRLFKAIESGNVDGVRSVYAPGIEVWHNTDGKVQTRDENLATLRSVVSNIKELSYTNVRRQPTPEGFVQQHVLVGQLASGKKIELPACIIGTIENGQITRIDEYLDSAAVAALR